MGENVMERKLPEVSLKKLLGGLSPVVAVLIAFAVAGLVVLASGGNPLEAYRALAKGALGSWVGVKNTIRYTLPIILLAFSFSICNRCGYFNIGQEGQMYFAALGIAFVPQVIPNAPLWVQAVVMVAAGALFGGLISLLPAVFKFLFGVNEVVIAILLTLLVALVYALFVFELDVDPIICALACTTIATGLTRYLLVPIFGASGRFILPSELALPTIHFAFLEKIPLIGPVLNDHSVLVYLALLLPFAVHVFLYRTNMGLSVRAIGKNADAALSAGIGIKRIRYFALALNGVFCGLAGAQLALSLNMFNVGMTDGRGFTAIAVLVLTGAEPVLSLLACLMFGFSDALVLTLSGRGYPVQILSMLPYVLALIVVIAPLLIKSLVKWLRKRSAEKKLIVMGSDVTAGDRQ